MKSEGLSTTLYNDTASGLKQAMCKTSEILILIFEIWMKNAGLKFEGVCVYAENKNQIIRKTSETLILIFEIWMQNAVLEHDAV